MITYQRIINLLSFLLIVTEWDKETIDYLEEKYYRVFNSLPNKQIKYDDIFLNKINNYNERWGYLSLSNEQILILLVYEKLHRGYYKNTENIISRYSKLFTSFNYINNIELHNFLHQSLKNFIKQYEKIHKDRLFKYKRIDKILRINDTINKNT